MKKYLCIHGHFYQPPREHPGLESVERQDSAHPYHDWNERITAECYAPNSAARILDDTGRISKIVNTYSQISFNFGPTLLTWLEKREPGIYARILAADQASQERFSGHGSALAQAYNHTILPLATRDDKELQVRWGIRDFEHRFGRRPEGMWLPETAVDLESLTIMAAHGIKFTVLAPHQAARVRAPGAPHWTPVPGASVDTTRPYRVNLPTGGSIAVFFYNGPVARAIAFEGLLKDGRKLADALRSGFAGVRDEPKLMHVATDGETFGHHHQFGDMALAYALDRLTDTGNVHLTNYGEYLEQHPPAWEAEIYERTAWSCVHGVGRWETDCGCHSGAHLDYHQRWRAPLREALDFLRKRLLEVYDRHAGRLFPDPRRALIDYIDIVLDRTPEHVRTALDTTAGRPLTETEQVAALKLLEIQRSAQLMYTSCGWFFDDVSGIETVQLLHYAGRALQLAADFTPDDLEAKFVSMLVAARSNLPEYANGRNLYLRFVKPARIDLPRVAANAAITGLFDTAPRERLHCFQIEDTDRRVLESGRARLGAGRIVVTSEVTLESAPYSYITLHQGNHHAICAVQPWTDASAHDARFMQIAEPFQQNAFDTAVRRLKSGTPDAFIHTLQSLFRDEQDTVLAMLTDTTLAEVERAYRQLYHDHTALMSDFGDLGATLPRPFKVAAELVVQSELDRVIGATPIDSDRIKTLFHQANQWGLKLDRPAIEFHLKQLVDHAAAELRETPHQPARILRLLELVELRKVMPVKVDLWKAQNIFYDLLGTAYASASSAAPADSGSLAWHDMIARLGDQLGVRVHPGS